MTRLNQIIAVVKDIKNSTDKALTAQYHRIQKGPLYFGIEKVYRKRDDEGEDFPNEKQIVQVKAEDQLQEIRNVLSRLFDVTATLEWGNTKAVADVTVDDVVLLKDAPVTYLLFLEKQLINIRTDLRKFPVLDTAEPWTWDEQMGLWKSDTTVTTKGKKIPRNHVKAAATDKHPAQVEVYFEDVQVGTWHTTKYSGAMSPKRVVELLDRVEKLQLAVKFAREAANNAQVDQIKVSDKIFDYLFNQ